MVGYEILKRTGSKKGDIFVFRKMAQRSDNKLEPDFRIVSNQIEDTMPSPFVL